MTEHKKYKNESQDARRHDKHNAAHPEVKDDKNHTKTEHHPSKKK